MYVMIENTPGYLPEADDPATFEDLSEASAYLRDEVERYCECLDEVETPYEVGLDDSPLPLWGFVTRTDTTHDLGRSFEIVESEES